MTVYILLTYGEQQKMIYPIPDISIEVYESLKDVEAESHRAVKIYEYTDGKLTLMERTPVYKTVLKEVQEIESFSVSAASVRG
jgi:hypothetical protein